MTTAGLPGSRTLGGLQGRLEGWAVARSLNPVSLTGISVALAVCAAGWLSAGTLPASSYGALALCGSYLAGRAARQLARTGAGPGPVSLYPASLLPAALARLGGTISLAIVCAGLAAGGSAAHLGSTWELATTTLIVITARDLADACRGGVADGSAGGSATGRAVRGILAFPAGGRVAVIIIVAPVWGARLALLILLEWAVVAIGYDLTGPRPRPAQAAAGPVPAGGLVPAAATVAATGPVPAAAPVPDAGPVAPAEPAFAGAAEAEPDSGIPESLALMMEEEPPAEPGQPSAAAAPAVAPDPRLLAVTLASRDDGWAAARLGRLVRGEFVPLPPALAGLAATLLLAWLGMRDLDGLLLLTPLVVMMLAGFGSAHPHDRALDWLTPAVLLAGQLGYTAAVGFSFGVPAPLTYGLCALIALRCLALASSGQPAPGPGLGWEGRMLIVGAGAMTGIATIAYLLLAAQVAVSLGGRALPRALPRPAGSR